MMIEQPLSHDDIIDHAELQAQLQTPICLDECIRTAHHAEQAIQLRACGIINIKLGRVGGFREAQARARCRAGGRHSGVVRRHAGSGHRPRAQHRAGDAAEFRAAGRRLGQQALLEAGHHSAGGGDHAARHHRDARRAGLRLRARPRLHPQHHGAGRDSSRLRGSERPFVT